MATVPEGFLDLLTTKTPLAHLATIMPDGSPQVTPVWFDYAGGVVRVNSARGRVKSRNMTVGAAVALSIVDPDNDYRYIQLRGRVTKVTEAGGDAHIDALARKYLGVDTYPYRRAGEVRVIFEITPFSAQAMG
jgi:PPOX class probable F420-dependent enzyme